MITKLFNESTIRFQGLMRHKKPESSLILVFTIVLEAIMYINNLAFLRLFQ